MNIQNLINDVLMAIIAVVIPIVAQYAIRYLESKRMEFENKQKQYMFNNTMIAATDIVEKVVDYVSQTMVDDLKAHGKFDNEMKKVAYDDAVKMIKQLLNDDVQKLIIATYGDLNNWIQVTIESYINAKK